MRVLALETALAWGGAALLDTGTGASYVRAAGIKSRLSAELFPAIEELLDEAGWAPGDIEMVTCSSGPGSFTGLRVGFAAVKGWYLATGCAVKAIPTFDVMASALTPLHFPAVGCRTRGRSEYTTPGTRSRRRGRRRASRRSGNLRMWWMVR